MGGYRLPVTLVLPVLCDPGAPVTAPLDPPAPLVPVSRYVAVAPTRRARGRHRRPGVVARMWGARAPIGPRRGLSWRRVVTGGLILGAALTSLPGVLGGLAPVDMNMAMAPPPVVAAAAPAAVTPPAVVVTTGAPPVPRPIPRRAAPARRTPAPTPAPRAARVSVPVTPARTAQARSAPVVRSPAAAPSRARPIPAPIPSPVRAVPVPRPAAVPRPHPRAVPVPAPAPRPVPSGCAVAPLAGTRPWVSRAGRTIMAAFGVPESRILGRGGRATPGSDHPLGLALDFVVDRATGDRLADYALAHRGALGVTYVIWRQRYNPGTGWQPMADRGSATANHFDHVHVSFTAADPGC